MSLAEVFAPAIHVARHGYVIDQVWFDQVQANRDWFDDIPASAALFLDPDGTPRDVGTVFTNPALAATYERIAHLGAKGFYRGAVADALVDTVRHPVVSPTANHVWRPGVIQMRDLHFYTAPERAPTHVNYRGLDVYSMGPPSSGGSTVGEALNILEGYSLSSMPREQALHYYLEASRYSFADRNAYLADPAYFDVPLSGLLSDEYAATRRALIKDDGGARRRPAGRPVSVRGIGDDDSPGDVGRGGERRLVHVHDRVHRRRRPGRPGLRVPAQQRADRLQLRLADPSEPRRGRKAPAQLDGSDDRHEGGTPFLAFGSPGGATIITTVLQILLDRVDLGLTLPQAIADPRASQRNALNTGVEPAFLGSRSGRRSRLAAITSWTRARSAPRLGSSSCPMAACSQPPSRSAAAAAAR